MMNFISNLFRTNPLVTLLVPTALSGVSFLGHILLAVSDGVITDSEFHSMAMSANGVELAILTALMGIIKFKSPIPAVQAVQDPAKDVPPVL